MEGRSVELLLSRAQRVSDSGKSIGIGCATTDDMAIIFCDFSKPVLLGVRPTGLILPPKTMIDGARSFIYTKAAVVGTFELYLNAVGDLSGSIANSAIGVGPALLRPIAGALGAEVKITSVANVTSGIIAAYLRLIPLP
jgi:hypothetical protein